MRTALTDELGMFVQQLFEGGEVTFHRQGEGFRRQLPLPEAGSFGNGLTQRCSETGSDSTGEEYGVGRQS